MRAKYVVIGVVIGVLLSTMVVLAGNLEPINPPATTSSYTLEDIYQRLSAGTAGTASTFTEPLAGPGSTMHTLNDIMGIAPAVDDTNGAVPGDVLNGKTYWGLRTGDTWGMQTGSAVPAPVPKTGQTNCYKSAEPWVPCACGTAHCPSGQDGDLEKGVAWPSPRFITGTTGVVSDTLTGLIWLEDADCADATREWEIALSDVVQLNADGTMNGNPCNDTSNGGSHQTDWRLPNLRELQSLVHYGVTGPALPNTAGTGKWSPGDPFTAGISWGNYWSSSTYESQSLQAWQVDMGSGDVNHAAKDSISRVWPVRGGQ